jgi:hypothetical protein
MSAVFNFDCLRRSTLDCGTKIVKGTLTSNGTFTLNSSGTLKIGSPDGISNAGIGNVQAQSQLYSVNGNFIYNGSVNQSTGNGLPSLFTITGTVQIANTGSSGNNIVTLSVGGTTLDTLKLISGFLGWAVAIH